MHHFTCWTLFISRINRAWLYKGHENSGWQLNVDLAQLVGHWPHDPEVLVSNPTGGYFWRNFFALPCVTICQIIWQKRLSWKTQLIRWTSAFGWTQWRIWDFSKGVIYLRDDGHLSFGPAYLVRREVMFSVCLHLGRGGYPIPVKVGTPSQGRYPQPRLVLPSQGRYPSTKVGTSPVQGRYPPGLATLRTVCLLRSHRRTFLSYSCGFEGNSVIKSRSLTIPHTGPLLDNITS